MGPVGGTPRLARLIVAVDRYGDAIEYDLHERLGLDLIDFFRGRHSWRKLAVLIDQLPPGSAYWAARAGDVEAAEAYLADHPEGPPKGSARPSLRDMTPEGQRLLAIDDRLAEISAKLDLVNGHETAKVDPQPRPLFGLDMAEKRAERRAVDSLVSEVQAAMARSAEQT